MNVFTNQRAMMVKNLRPGLTECGKIKIGKKGRVQESRKGKEFQPPEKLDHFVVTTLQRGRDGNFLPDREVHHLIGEQPREIPVRLLFNDPWLNFQTVYTAFHGAKRWCVGDGETAQRMGVEGAVACPCERLDPAYTGDDKCKINGTLSVVIDGAAVVGGVWKLRTTSINTCQGIASSLALLSSVTGGQLAGVPLTLAIRPKAATTPQGQQATVYVVGLEFRGTVEQLRDHAYRMALADGSHGERMKHVEDQARALLAAPGVASEDLDTVEEFYPEAAAREHGATITPPVNRSDNWTHPSVAAPPADEPQAPYDASQPEPDLIELADKEGEWQQVKPAELPMKWAELLGECTSLDELSALAKANEAGSKAKMTAKLGKDAAEAYMNRRTVLGNQPAQLLPATVEARLRDAADRDAANAILDAPEVLAALRGDLEPAERDGLIDALGQHYGDGAAVLDETVAVARENLKEVSA